MMIINYTQIICTVIESVAIIVAAILGAKWLGTVGSRRTSAYFYNYALREGAVKSILRRAKNDITIVVAYGDSLLKECESLLSSRLNDGIEIHFLMVTEANAISMDTRFFNQDPSATINQIHQSKKALKRLKCAHPNFHVREIDSFITASYIGIDLIGKPGGGWLRSALIQIMLYQYHTESSKSPITYISPKRSSVQFQTTVDSVQEMWEAGQVVTL